MGKMAARILIVEDEEDFISAIRQVLTELSPACQIRTARSRDSAQEQLERDFFDFIILDLKIPTSDGRLDTDPQHGFAVFRRAQAIASGTPVFVLTGSPAENFISDLLESARQVDIWGEGRFFGTVNFLPKYKFDQFPERLSPSIYAIDALSEVELDRGDIELSIADDRLVRIFSRRFGGARVVASALGGGLSGAKVLRLRITDARGAIVHDAVAKLGSLAIVMDEGQRFEELVSRLEARVTPRKLATLEVGAGGSAGVFYGLAAGFEETAFQAAVSNAEHARASVTSIEGGTRRWSDGVYESRRYVHEVRRRLLCDQDLLRIAEQFGLSWTTDFEARQVQVRWCCVHGDLHGENVLVAQDGTAVIIDYGEVGEGTASLDPVTLELSLLFHPKGPLRGSGRGFGPWPTAAQARRWGDIDQYVEGCSAAPFISVCRDWANRIAAGRREIAASAYGYLMRQLKYDDTNKDLALALLEGVRAYNEST